VREQVLTLPNSFLTLKVEIIGVLNLWDKSSNNNQRPIEPSLDHWKGVEV
jgi:hypothetical protein